MKKRMGRLGMMGIALLVAGAAQAASYTNEPMPNGGRLNVGLYGGTAEASKSNPDPWLFAMSFNDGGNLIQNARLEWVASLHFNGQQVVLQYSTNNGAGWNNIATVAATNEVYSWAPTFAHAAVLWRVAATDFSVASTNARPFSVRPTTNTAFKFYVNDDSLANDVYCSAVGSSTNLGISSNAPKRGLQQVIDSYSLRGGDTVYVDTGDYTTNVTVSIGVFDSGTPGNPVRIIGSPNGSTLNRGSTSADVLNLAGSHNLLIENLRLMGGQYGLNDGVSNLVVPVSYTHLDVYKRQILLRLRHDTSRNTHFNVPSG